MTQQLEQSLLEKKSLYLEVLQDIHQFLTETDAVEDTLLRTLIYLLQKLGYSAAQIYQLTRSGSDLWLYLEAGQGHTPATQNTGIFSLEEQTIIGDAIRHNEPIHIANIQEGPYAYYKQTQTQVESVSELAIPLKYQKNPLGVLSFQAPNSDTFDSETISFLGTVARLLASYLGNNQTIKQLQDSIQEVRTLYNIQYDDHARQSAKLKRQTSTGYQYDRQQILPLDDLSQSMSADPVGLPELDTDLVIPIQLQGETVGVLGVEDGSDNMSWAADDINMLEEISAQVALAIENAQLLEQTQERTKELSILFEATRQLTETINLNEIYTVLTNQVINYLGGDRCSVLHLDETGKHFEVSAEKSRRQNGQSAYRSEPRIVAIDDVTLLRQILEQPDILIHQLDDPNLHPDTHRYMTRDETIPVHTLTLFPLLVRTKLAAILEVEHLQRPHHYTTDELQLAQAIVAQVSVAIENAQLFQQTQTALADTQKLHEISSALVESESLEDIFEIVLDNVKSYDVDRVSISLFDKSVQGDIESVTIVSTWDSDPGKDIPVGTKFSADKFSLVQTFAQPPFHPLISHDLRQPDEQDPRMDESFRSFVVKELQAVTLFSAPMFLGNEYKGVLSIYTRKPHIYSNQEVTIYQTLADQAIIAIETHRLLEATKKERDRTTLLYELGQQLNLTTTIDEVQNVVLSFGRRANVTHTEIYITDGELFISAASTIPQRQGITPEDLVETAFSQGPEALALNKGEKIIQARSTVKGAWPLDKLPGMPEISAVVSIPFYSQRSTLQGVLTFLDTQADNFTEEQLATFDSMAIQTAATLENVWLLEQTNIVLRETEMLYEATRRFNIAQTVEDLLSIMVDNFAETGIDFMSISTLQALDEDGAPLKLDTAASWQKQTNSITSDRVSLTPENYSFLKQMRYDTHLEIYFHKLDAVTQTNVDHQLYGSRTLLAIPLAVGQVWLGALLMGSQTDNYFFKLNNINQIFSLAGQAAVVIQNLKLVEETQQNLFNSEILSNLGRELLNAETVENIYELTTKAIAETEPDRGVSIMMYEQIEGSIDLELVALWDNPRQDWPGLPIGSRLSTADLDLIPLLRTGDTVVSNQAVADERFSPVLRQLIAMMQINVMAAIPLWLNKKVEGFILVGNQTHTPFSADVIRLYEDIARETSGALENRRLFDEAQYQARQLQIAAEVSQAATGYLDLETLLSESVDLIKERFGFYHVSIFLVDDYQKYAVVRASTGEAGQSMLAVEHKVPVGGPSIVGAATGTGKPKIALDVEQDAVHFNNPLLPETRSKMALPLIAQGRIIGALDVQSAKRGAFDQSDLTILQSMANQLANAIEAVRAVQDANKALEEVSKIHQHYVREQWDTYIRQQKPVTRYCLSHGGQLVEENESDLTPEIKTVIQEKRPIITQPALKSRATSEHSAGAPVTGNGSNEGNDSPTPAPDLQTSTLIAPLMLDGQAVLGAVDFEITTQNIDTAYDDDDLLKIIEAVTSQAAQAIESARLFEQTQISREEAEALYEVGRILVATEDEQEMFNTVLGKMLSTLGLKQGGILFFEEDQHYGKLHALFENGKPVKNPTLRFPIKDNPSYQKLIASKQPVAIEDVAVDPLVATVREINLARGTVSLLLVPIIIDDEVIGAMGADSVGQKHIFTESEINLAVAMSDQLSITLQNRRLIEETKKRAVLLQTSSDVGRVATSILDQEAMLDEAVELIRERFGFYHAQIFLIDEAEQFAVLHKSSGETGKKLLDMNYKVAIGSQSVIGQVTHQRQPIVMRSLEIDNNGTLKYQRNEFLPETQAELAIPLQVGETLIGALDVQSKFPGAFTDEEIATLELLAAQLAIAIQNARAFKEQQETATRLKEIDKLKTQFLANMSHELRTPLNSIIGFSRVILKGIDGPLTELQKTDLTSIHNSGQHLLGLINNILDLSKIEAGKMELNFEETEVEPIIKTVMSTAIALVKDKPVELREVIPDDLPKIWADPTRVRQVILNLVSNACKFTERGSVTTEVKLDQDKVVFSVKDTGIGIPEDQLATIFQEFTQVDASTTRKVGGTGLGLPISRHFVELHHGKMWVDSAPGRGSTFSFHIPIKPPPEEEPEEVELSSSPQEAPSQSSKKVIAAIDDDPGVVSLYQRFLEKQGYEVVGIKPNENILQQLKDQTPFAILLDVILPEKDGWGLIKELKENAFLRDIPVIICSIASDKNRGFSLGAANFLVKPIVEQELIEALKRIDNSNKDEIHVLIVDDKADDILLIRRILEAQSNYYISEAGNGKEGLELVDRKKPDLIILDLNMPEIDGFAMLEALKGNEETRAIPIIIVSAEALTQEEHDKLTGQVEVMLHKGIFTENELLEDVSQALQRFRSPVI